MPDSHQNSIYGAKDYRRQCGRLLASLEGMNDAQRRDLLRRVLDRFDPATGIPAGAERRKSARG